MSLMLKLLMSSVAATLMMSAATFDLERFVKSSVIKNPAVKVNSVRTIATKEIPGNKDWKVYFVIVELTFKGKNAKEPITLFVDEKGGLAALNLMNSDNGKAYRDIFKPDMPDSYYDEAHLILGSKDSKHKMVIFSDPQCPFCTEYVPDVIKSLKGKSDKVALYYYHMPLLRLHPVADALTRVMEVLQKAGKKEQAMRVYGLKIDYREKDETKILTALKEQLNIDVSKEAIAKPEIKAAVKKDISLSQELMINGTPTVYFDGIFDKTRNAYKSYIK